MVRRSNVSDMMLLDSCQPKLCSLPDRPRSLKMSAYRLEPIKACIYTEDRLCGCLRALANSASCPDLGFGGAIGRPKAEPQPTTTKSEPRIFYDRSPLLAHAERAQ